MSRKMPSDSADQNMQSLMERILRLETENKRLKEKSTLEERATVIQKTVKIELPASSQNQNGVPQTQTVDMGAGIKMTIAAETTKTNKVTLSWELKSSTELDATLIMKTGIHRQDGYGNRGGSDCLVDFLRISQLSVKGSKQAIDLQNGGYNNYKTTVTIVVKMILMPQDNSTSSENNATVTVLIQNQKLLVDVPYVSKWSQFLQAYFASQMKEKASGIYPINDCSLADFREMLEVIYPSSKPIDENNVEAMLDLGDRFIMPMLTRKCEVFLSKNTSHGITEIRMIAMADRFNLIRTRTIVLERLSSTALIRSKIIQAAGYESLSIEMKREVDARYVQLDVMEREGNHNRGY